MSKLHSITCAAVLAVSFLASGAADAASKKPPAPMNTKAAIAAAKNAILWRLKDPESARWRQAKVASNGNVCIEVNAKNSFGGYTGFTVYLYNSQKRTLVSGETDLAGMYCRMSRVMPNAVYVNVQ